MAHWFVPHDWFVSHGSTIPASLQGEKMSITSAQGHQRFVAAALDDTALFENQNLIRHPYRRKSMRDDDGNAISLQIPEGFEHLRLSPPVNGRRGLARHQ